MDPVGDFLMERFEEVPVGFHRDEGAVLLAEVGSCDIDGRHAIPDCGKDSFQIPDSDLALALKDFVNVVAARDRADVPLFDVTNASRMPDPRSWNIRNITETRPSKVGQNGFVRLGV